MTNLIFNEELLLGALIFYLIVSLSDFVWNAITVYKKKENPVNLFNKSIFSTWLMQLCFYAPSPPNFQCLGLYYILLVDKLDRKIFFSVYFTYEIVTM